MSPTPQESLYESLLHRLTNNRIIALGLITFGVLVGAGKLTGALDDTWEFIQARVLGRSTALRKEYCELLQPLAVELDRTKAAFARWDKKNLSLESETIRDGDLKARALLREKAHLVPSSLRADQRKLIFHYDQWLEEYDRIRVRKEGSSDEPFVFVYSFPHEAEQHFISRMAEVEAKLGSESPCR